MGTKQEEADRGSGGPLRGPALTGTDARQRARERRLPVPAGLVAIGEYLGRLGQRYAPLRGIEGIEHRLLSELDERMQRARANDRRGEAQRTFFVPIHEPPAKVLDALLDMAARQTVEDAREYLYTALLRELVPDEVCMLAALADGRPRGLLHITAAGRFGGGEEQPVTRNVTDLGAAAGVKLQGMSGHYLGHLLALGLAEEADETPATRSARATLKALPVVAASLRAIREQGLRPRFRYGSVAISRLGSELWAFCRS